MLYRTVILMTSICRDMNELAVSRDINVRIYTQNPVFNKNVQIKPGSRCDPTNKRKDNTKQGTRQRWAIATMPAQLCKVNKVRARG